MFNKFLPALPLLLLAAAAPAPIAPSNLPICSSTAPGAVPATGGSSGRLLRDDCTWATPPGVSLGAANTWTAPQRGNTSVPANTTATITPVVSASQNYRVSLNAQCPCAVANPSGTLVAGQTGIIEVAQDATGTRVVSSWGSAYQYVGGTSSIVLSTAVNAVDYIPYYVESTGTYIVLGGYLKGPTH